MAISPTVRINVSGARGESQADILRRTGQYGVLPTDTDAQAMSKLNAVAQAIADAAVAGSNYRATLVEGIADFAVGEYFTSAETGEIRVYKRIAGSPFYEDQGDGAAPVSKSAVFDKPDARVSIQASESIAQGAFVNIYGSGASTRVRNADATDPAKFANGHAPDAILSGGSGAVFGFGLNASVVVSGPYSEVWLSDVTPGGFMTSPPTTEGHIIQSLGPAMPSIGILFFPQARVIL